MTFQELRDQLEAKIQETYEQGITQDEAERLAGRFLYGQLKVSKHLRATDLDARMRKSGLKAVRASVYADIVGKHDKKPTVDAMDHMLNAHELVNQEQDGLDKAEVERNELERLYDVFVQAHVYYRQMSKGRFEG